jgi:hypothetical protein
MERSPLFMFRINSLKIAILLNTIYRCNAIPTKSPMSFFIKIEKVIVKFMWKHKKPQTVKAILSKTSKTADIAVSNFKLYCRAI